MTNMKSLHMITAMLFSALLLTASIVGAQQKNPFLDKEFKKEPVVTGSQHPTNKIPMPPPPTIQSARFTQPNVEEAVSLLDGFRTLGKINGLTALINDKTGEVKLYPNKSNIGVAVGVVEFRKDKEIVFIYKSDKNDKPDFKDYFPVLGVDLKKKYEVVGEINGVKICFDGKMYELASLGWACSDNLNDITGR